MHFRYKIYIEGWAWSVSEKYIFACNSPVLLMTLRWYDFFIRGMVPQHHYWPVRDEDKCRSLKYAVEWGNNHTEKVNFFLFQSAHRIYYISKEETIRKLSNIAIGRQSRLGKLGVASSMRT